MNRACVLERRVVCSQRERMPVKRLVGHVQRSANGCIVQPRRCTGLLATWIPGPTNVRVAIFDEWFVYKMTLFYQGYVHAVVHSTLMQETASASRHKKKRHDYQVMSYSSAPEIVHDRRRRTPDPSGCCPACGAGGVVLTPRVVCVAIVLTVGPTVVVEIVRVVWPGLGRHLVEPFVALCGR